MNMNKALQNLYHAVSGSTTTKVNISKLLVDIHYAITDKESENKNNWSKIINSMADNWPEGGGGSSDLSTAEVTITNALADVFKIVLLPVIIENEQMTGVAGVYPLLLDTQNSITLTVPLYKGQCLWFTSYEEYADYTFAGTGSVDVNPLGITITGDCTITIS